MTELPGVVAAIGLEEISSVVTVALAFAALVAAGITIRDARGARREADEAHRETMNQQAALLESTIAAHGREMAERRTASLRDQVLQRVIRLGSIGRLVADVAVIAGKEAAEAGEFRPDAEGPALAGMGSAVVPLLKRLEFELQVYEDLGGEMLSKLHEWAERMQWPTLPRATIMSHAQSRLFDLAEVVSREGKTLSDLSQIGDSLYRDSNQEALPEPPRGQ
jgi:hypothetical protein